MIYTFRSSLFVVILDDACIEDKEVTRWNRRNKFYSFVREQLSKCEKKSEQDTVALFGFS